MTGPARGAVTQEAVDLILTVAVDARVRLAFVNVYIDTQPTSLRDVIKTARLTL